MMDNIVSWNVKQQKEARRSEELSSDLQHKIV